jgi:hypothetical protein
MKKRLLPLFAALFSIILTAVSCGSTANGIHNARRVEWYQSSNSGTDTVLENEYLEFRLDPASAEFMLTEKGTGTIWRSNPEGTANDAAADALTKQRMRSQFILAYSNTNGVDVSMNSARYSVDNGMYQYTKVDGGIEVDYTISTVNRLYYIPQAIRAERLAGFTEKMTRAERAQVEGGYRLIDINNLEIGDNKDTLLTAYPDLEDGKVHILRDNVQDFIKGRIEDFLTAAGYTFEDYEEDAARYNASSESVVPVFNVTIRYELDGNALLVSVPLDKIAYRKEYPIIQLSLLPYFGAGSIYDEGYLVVPDGSGALIHFNNGKHGQLEYNNTVYGWDIGMFREAVVQDNVAPFPVFGTQKNGAAIICVMEEGASYGSIAADVSGRNSSWNRVYGQFSLLRRSVMSYTIATSNSVAYMYQGNLPVGEKIVERFIPCKEDGYVGMAKEYREYLLDKKPELKKRDMGGVPVAVEIIGAVDKIQHRFGIPMEMPLKLTSYQEAEKMVKDFASFGWEDVYIKMTGWFNGSVEHTPPSHIGAISELGGKNDFKNLAAAADEFGYHFYGEADFLYIKDHGLFDGFNSRIDAARYITREIAELYPFSIIWFGYDNWNTKPRYLARPAYMTRLVEGFTQKAEKLGLTGIAFRSIGSKLGSDYYDRRFVSRESSMNTQQKILQQLMETGKGIMLKKGFAFAVPYADIVTDMALSDQKFGITDSSIPFYQIALHGLVPYTGSAINLAEDYTLNVLSTIESGGGLYFSFMTENSAHLQNTSYKEYYANQYDKWIGDAVGLYQQFSRDFEGLYSQRIVNHEIIAPLVTVTEYEDGTRVIVNAGKIANQYDGVIVKPLNYAVIRGGQR